MSRAKAQAERIRKEVPLIQVLVDYGFDVDHRDGDRETQFSCTLHGDGSDSKPSARYYPETGQYFCFACGRSRDAIAVVREKEGCGFGDAVRKLEQRFGLQPLPWDPADEERTQTPRQAVEASLRRQETAEEALKRVERFLFSLTKERSLDPQRCAGLWEAYDRVVVYLAEDGDEVSGVRMAHKVLTAAKEALKSSMEP